MHMCRCTTMCNICYGQNTYFGSATSSLTPNDLLMTQLMVPPTALTMMAALQIGQVPHGRFFTLVTYVHSFEYINLYGSQQCSLKVWSNMHPAHTQNIGNIYTLESRIGGCQWMAPFVGWRGSLPSSTTFHYCTMYLQLLPWVGVWMMRWRCRRSMWRLIFRVGFLHSF